MKHIESCELMYTITLVKSTVLLGSRSGVEVRGYHVQHIAAHLDQEAVESSRVGEKDLQQVSSSGCLGLQPPDGPLDVGLMGPLTQDHQVLAWHTPCCLEYGT